MPGGAWAPPQRRVKGDTEADLRGSDGTPGGAPVTPCWATRPRPALPLPPHLFLCAGVKPALCSLQPLTARNSPSGLAAPTPWPGPAGVLGLFVDSLSGWLAGWMSRWTHLTDDRWTDDRMCGWTDGQTV